MKPAVKVQAPAPVEPPAEAPAEPKKRTGRAVKAAPAPAEPTSLQPVALPEPEEEQPKVKVTTAPAEPVAPVVEPAPVEQPAEAPAKPEEVVVKVVEVDVPEAGKTLTKEEEDALFGKIRDCIIALVNETKDQEEVRGIMQELIGVSHAKLLTPDKYASAYAALSERLADIRRLKGK
ncbi:MAG: hypothetical protein NC080_07310 [Paraprevotella sp.]|nr:hypothetical protein [Paraprevotella sp.]